MKSKKAQAEIIGLVIIVVMLSLGLLFLAQFAFDSSGEKKVFTRKGLAYSSMSSIMKTTVLCEQSNEAIFSLKVDILEDCARSLCPGGGYDCPSDIRCSNMHSCEFLEQEISLMLEETLGSWSKEYVFTSVLQHSGGETELFRIQNGPCFGDRDSSGQFPLNVEGSGIVSSTLFICD